MNRIGDKCMVFLGETCLGELESVPVPNPTPNPNPNPAMTMPIDTNFKFPNNEIRIHHISPLSERCPPLSILQSISFSSLRCKLEPSSNSPIEHPHLINLHASCFHELKTAVVVVGDEEIHLVAMPSKQKKFPCFWCYSVPSGLYASCLGMLNLRCLAIVFDLDETLIVANTMKSFEDRIDILRSWLARETDPVRLAGMSAEFKRYMDDRALLKQYADADCVVDTTTGMTLKVQLEEVALVSDGQGSLIRPVIRLPDRNIVLTRINPEIRDTSVLVRLRPAWEDLRSYLTAKGRKRFEVYVCTMAERDYALEMWRLLDPEAHLISQKQLSHRVVCVKSGSRKSLLSVFQGGVCHPKMSMVIDDRSKVWEDKDQPRVHVVPPFTPYYAPQAETANAVPVLCVARNVACNVRGGFFKEFDEILLRRISELFYEDEAINLPPAPDVSNYLLSEDTGFVANGNGAAPIAEGMRGAEVERMIHPSIYLDDKSNLSSTSHFIPSFPEFRSDISQPTPSQAALSNIIVSTIPRATLASQKGLLGAPIRRDSGVSESDSDARKRPLTKNGQDIRNASSGDPPILSRVPGQSSWSSVQSQGGRLVEEEVIGKGQLNNRVVVISPEGDSLKLDKPQPHQNAFNSTCDASTSGFASQVSQVHPGNDWQRQNFSPKIQSSVADGATSQSQAPYSTRELQGEVGKVNGSTSSLSIGVLQEIGRRCCTKVEFRSVVSTSEDLQFSVEVLFTGEKIGAGMGKTRRDAHQQAAENALRSLADKYIEYFTPRSGTVNRDFDKSSLQKDNGFLCDVINAGSIEISTAEGLHTESSSKTAGALEGSFSTNAKTFKLTQVIGHKKSPSCCRK